MDYSIGFIAIGGLMIPVIVTTVMFMTGMLNSKKFGSPYAVDIIFGVVSGLLIFIFLNTFLIEPAKNQANCNGPYITD